MDYFIENEYLKVMKCFRETNMAIQIEKMEKLTFLVEDEVLKEKMKDYIEVAKYLPEDSHLKNFKGVDPEKVKETLAKRRILNAYIEERINGDKPYWQIIAEQKGWIPPEIIPNQK